MRFSDGVSHCEISDEGDETGTCTSDG
jgi:hypothetical protein